ncbi:hypothetical protein HYPSUDRAFT_54564 [Hypholoma sublateritium FD-334 SS-4]|uniref:ubiquitinyl hydrolase 1 n=1 Tax=Hypholoma sublateritium (strain FD-334 SS-4) TaxID=945553 RepID=A0A0D2NWN3_HYPSF|nr:hypothetical protein HYPSUDRAFT_54564 [Hypholoma sublateritium FD-334 SS-4]
MDELQYAMNHVFLPPKLPQEHDPGPQASLGDIALCRFAYEAALQFPQYLAPCHQTQWNVVTKMLKNLLDTTKFSTRDDRVSRIVKLRVGEALAFHIRAQNAGLLLRKNSGSIIFEAFEVSPPPKDVMSEEGKLLCSYPGPAIEVPLGTSQNLSFVEQFVSFISNMDIDQLDTAQTTTKAGSTVQETRGTNDPKYITQLLMAILHGMGREASVERFTKRIADEVCWKSALNPWRRSPRWLVLRVAAQRMSESRGIYKQWMLFFHARLLQLFLDNNFSSDLLHVARVKTGRRAHKLGDTAPPLLLKMVKDVVQAVQLQLQERWSEEQQDQALSPAFVSNALATERDTKMSLDNSRAYLSEVLLPERSNGLPSPFEPTEKPRLRSLTIDTIFPDAFTRAAQADPYVALADFEDLVQDHLDSWTQQNLREESASITLKTCLEQYMSAAKHHYGSNAEDKSRMLLVIMDLWVALDVVVCFQHPLLLSYSPEIPASILEPLLVRTSISFDRAAKIERYLLARHADVDRTSTSIYASEITSTTFSVRYFDRTQSMQALKSSIESTATAQRASKRAELGDLNAEHTKLMRQIASIDCTYYTTTDRYGFSHERHDNRWCQKCKLERQANSMHIDVHEWPLSDKPLEAKATVFKLDCPSAFSIWRTLTYQILRDIGMRHVNVEGTAMYPLGDYAGLQSWARGKTSARITFASTTKSFLVSHYRKTSIPATEKDVCVNNGLNYRLCDNVNQEVTRMPFVIDLYPYCTLQLPERNSAYSLLQYAVTHTTHSHNSTIVKQGNCPVDLSIHEQLAFTNLRCGANLQWMNIVRELRTRTLTFSREEVHTLLMQAAWQMGPLGGDVNLRGWHTELGVAEFGSVLIQEATDLLLHVESNWMEGNTVKTIIYLTSRLLASAADAEVILHCYALLRRARKTTHEWMRQIVCKLQTVTDSEATIGEMQRRACEMAAICRASFDVGARDHLDALLSSAADAAILIECSIVIHDNTPHTTSDSPLGFQKLLHRDRRLAHFLELKLARQIHTNARGLDDAVASVWPSYRPGTGGWQNLPGPNARWTTSFTDPRPNQRSQQVHYNLLTGKLLIDGKPLGRLPHEILGHSTYQRIFGQIFFAFQKRDSDVKHLIIRAQDQMGRTLELIPPDILANDFPHFLTEDYAHWMDTATGVVEFRPLKQLWECTSLDWQLDFSQDAPSMMFHGEKRLQRLIDIRSQTFQGIANRLHSLEHATHLTITLDMDCQPARISIDLPRFRLSFFLNDNGELESCNMRNMVIDGNQCTGTMIGLENQLVLRHKDSDFARLPRSRLVIIPHGTVQFLLNRNHVSVTIDTNCQSQHQVVWHKYDIDTDLGLLVGGVNLTSRLFKIYLHALCSHSLPDPLTSQTGTDHALQELRGAGCFSFQQLEKIDIDLLRLIGEISPTRCYYPKHLRVMQTTEWSSQLPVLSQHRSFDNAASRILDYAQSLAIFPELCQEVSLQWRVRSDPVLMARAERHAIYYQGDIGSSSDSDRRYTSKDCIHNTDAEMEALKISHLVYTWPVGLTVEPSSYPNLQACATIPSSLLDSPPQHVSYSLDQGYEPLRNKVLSIVSSNIYDVDDSPAGCLSRSPNEEYYNFKARLQRHYQDLSGPRINDAVDRLMAQWPCYDPQTPFHSEDASQWFRTEAVISAAKKYFADCFANRELKAFVSRLSRVLQQHCIPSPLNIHNLSSLQFLPHFNPAHISDSSQLTLELVLSSRDAPLPYRIRASHKFGEIGAQSLPRGLGQPVDTTALGSLIEQFESNHTTVLHQVYRDRLTASRHELHGRRKSSIPNECTPSIGVCIEYRTRSQMRMASIFSSLCDTLSPITHAEEILKDAGLWPPISLRTVLELLGSATCLQCSTEWTEILIGFAEAIIEYQHAQHLVGFALRSEVHNFFKELDNAAFNWSDAREYPIWLLIQIQGNFITRPLQSQVAREMISPSLNKNTVLQLNMGEGKSHVIVPLVSAALADSQKLVRVVVLKPLAKQMFQLLVERLSGLPNRRVFYLPFSRDVKATSQTTQKIRGLFEECARVGGILVAQPEHILSFRLMVVDRTLSSEGSLNQIARELHATQGWLHSASRDILDESDELLHVRYQLIYTMDQQQPLDGSPDRWTIVEKIFDLVQQHMDILCAEFPEEVELVNHRSTIDKANFPHFRLLGASAAKALVSRVANDVMNGRVENVTFVGLGFQASLRSRVLSFMTIRDLDPPTLRTVRDTYETTGLWKGLLLLRGLLAHGILTYCLNSRRWRVDYGLDPKRSMLAVPYRAKDVPSMRSEFGHPDIVLCLTCLTYYYGGLTSDQVTECFELVNKLDNPSLEYESWVERGREGIPPAIRQIIGVNMKDVDTFNTKIIPVFQHNKGTIDFYLSQVVFPREAKEFPHKLGTSGWDLAETKVNFTTGFSGTNDNSDLLPTTISQSDPVNQLRTNAQVLEFILRPENNRYLCMQDGSGQPCSAADLLHKLVDEPKEIRVLLDVGAQMLEMTNQQLVEHWLSLTSVDVAAGVFFDDSDSLTVLTHTGLVEPLHSSTFIQRLHQCIVYLDDAHTRGTDLKLPPDFRAMVTLGPKVTKDKLVQGCMRMRNLGYGQSVVFCAPPEVDRYIRKLEKVEASAPVQVVDVLTWAMSNTCADIENHVPHFVQQGVYYNKRQGAYSAFSTSQVENIEALRNSWLEPAARELDDMYGGHNTEDGNIMDLVKSFPAMHDRLKMLGITEVRDRSMAEEQEREVSHEMEEEAQLERPPEIPAAVHELHTDVQTFVRRATISPTSKAFLPLLSPLFSANPALGLQNRVRAKHLLGTRDFMTTTLAKNEQSGLTDYLRPINWIVSHVSENGTLTLVVMSPHEVNLLLDDIRKRRRVRLHVYAPRTSQSMKSFDDLAFYCIPPLEHPPAGGASLLNNIGYQLNIWAGQLYFDSYEAYLRTCLLLGISSSDLADDGEAVGRDRFVSFDGRTLEMAAVCLFDKSPVIALQKLFGLRRKGMSFQSTHMGKVLQARLLFPDEFAT